MPNDQTSVEKLCGLRLAISLKMRIIHFFLTKKILIMREICTVICSSAFRTLFHWFVHVLVESFLQDQNRQFSIEIDRNVKKFNQ